MLVNTFVRFGGRAQRVGEGEDEGEADIDVIKTVTLSIYIYIYIPYWLPIDCP